MRLKAKPSTGPAKVKMSGRSRKCLTFPRETPTSSHLRFSEATRKASLAHHRIISSLLASAQVFGDAPLSRLPEAFCWWASEQYDFWTHNIRHLAGRIREGNWASRKFQVRDPCWMPRQSRHQSLPAETEFPSRQPGPIPGLPVGRARKSKNLGRVNAGILGKPATQKQSSLAT